MLWFLQLTAILYIGAAGSRTASTGAERAGFPAAPFGKTPVVEGFPETEFAPAEFFFAHCPPGYVKIDVTGLWCGDLKN